MKKHTSFLSEWEKIKDANICTVEEFEKLFDSNPNGRCFRKYTSYPWSKENFFFGTYEDYLHFQKTNTEIPFYLSNKVGSKVFNLTLLSFFRDESNKICANCRCDCGNEVIKTYYSIQKGNARSCGCNRGRKAKGKNNIYDLMPEIIDEFWDFDKNVILPQDVDIDSEAEFWWKGYSNSYKIPLQYFVRNAVGTSFPEQTIRFFLAESGIDVINRYLVEYKSKKYELDLFLPQYNVGIEYDGAFWHLNKQDKDVLKTHSIENLGITFIRIREKGLSETGIKNGVEIIMNEPVSNVSLANIVNRVFSFLETLSSIEFRKINANDIIKNKSLIQSQYSASCLKDSIANHWLSVYWSVQNTIKPYFVSVKSSQKCYFECSQGALFYCSPNSLLSKLGPQHPENYLKCIFDCVRFCNRAVKIQKRLLLNILNVTLNPDETIDINFFIENRNESSFDPLHAGRCSIVSNEKFTSFACDKEDLTSKNLDCIDNYSIDPCAPEYNYFIGKHNFELLPFSRKEYCIKINRAVNIKKDADILIAFNLSDQMNWIYKVCIAVKIQSGKTSLSGKILTWKMYNSIIQNNGASFHHILDEDEAKRLIASL